MTSHYHAAVWLDHHEARVIYFSRDDVDEKIIHASHPPRHMRHTSGSPAGTHGRGDPAYYHEIANALGAAKEFLVAGPSTAKTEFVTCLRSHVPSLVDRLCGVETLPQMSDGQLVAEARRFFTGVDRMRPRIE